MQPAVQTTDNGPAAKRVRIDSNPITLSGDADEKCFVCDAIIVGKKYSLASCMTNGTKVRLVEVLGRLVSDSYMVVVSHGENICRGCANLLNTLDRLEAEISSVKRIVLNFVERKYHLGDRLQNQLAPTPVVYSKTVPSTYPAIAPKTPVAGKSPAAYTYKPIAPAQKKTNTTVTTPKTTSVTTSLGGTPSTAANTPMRTKSYKITLKDEQVLGQSQTVLQSAEQQVIGKTLAQQPAQRNVWMQCNQCQYTTNQRTVMLDHLRQHVAARNAAAQSKSAEGSDNKKTTASTPQSSTSSSTGSINGTPGSSKQIQTPVEPKKTVIISPGKDGGKPTFVLTSDGKLSKTDSTSGSKTIILKKTTAPGTVTTCGATTSVAGIVTKVLSTSSSSMGKKSVISQILSKEASKTITTSSTSQVAKVITTKSSTVTNISTGPQVFSSSTSKRTGPDPSLPILLADDDL